MSAVESISICYITTPFFSLSAKNVHLSELLLVQCFMRVWKKTVLSNILETRKTEFALIRIIHSVEHYLKILSIKTRLGISGLNNVSTNSLKCDLS